MITFLAAIVVLASIGVVAWPLVRGVSGRNGSRLVEDAEVSELLAQKDTTLLAISELESDYNMGNLSRSDYQELRQKYEEKAVALIKTVDTLRGERSRATAGDWDDEIEARVAAMRAGRGTFEPAPEEISDLGGVPADGKSCPGCGAHLEADDKFCFRCGAASDLKCPGCAAAVNMGDRFCFRCGAALSTGEPAKGHK